MSSTEILTSILVGLGLSAACGLRVFLPLLMLSGAALWGHLPLGANFAWMGTPSAFSAFGCATLVEVVAYYVPWLDHFLDLAMTPLAIMAGTLILASTLPQSNPLLKWSLALIAGGGAAGVVQTSSVLLRGMSLAGTGGLANPLVATLEFGGALLLSIFAIVLPAFTVMALILFLGIVGWRLLRRVHRASSRE